MAGIGATEYRNGARERIREASVLLRAGLWAGSVYLAGRAVEGMLRAVIWKCDRAYATGGKSLETGHDLRKMVSVIRNLGLFRDEDMRQSISWAIQRIGRLWSNDMRFWPVARVEQVWRRLREIQGKHTMKKAAQVFYDACSVVIKCCEALQ
jgi:HEPN domain-containing protein